MSLKCRSRDGVHQLTCSGNWRRWYWCMKRCVFKSTSIKFSHGISINNTKQFCFRLQTSNSQYFPKRWAFLKVIRDGSIQRLGDASLCHIKDITNRWSPIFSHQKTAHIILQFQIFWYPDLLPLHTSADRNPRSRDPTCDYVWEEEET